MQSSAENDALSSCRGVLLRSGQGVNSFSFIRDMVRYWRAPVFVRSRERLKPEGALALIGVVGLLLLAMIPLNLIVTSVMAVAGADMPAMSEEFEEEFTSGRFVYLAVLVAPLLEELLFRSWMGFRTGLLVVMPVGLCLISALFIFSSLGAGAAAVGHCAFMLGALGLYLSRWWSLRGEDRVLAGMTQVIFPWVFWGVIVLFGMIHIGNFEDGIPVFLWPLVVAPQMLAGAVLGYVRMRFGLLVAIGFHAAYNLVIVIITTLLMIGASDAAVSGLVWLAL